MGEMQPLTGSAHEARREKCLWLPPALISRQGLRWPIRKLGSGGSRRGCEQTSKAQTWGDVTMEPRHRHSCSQESQAPGPDVTWEGLPAGKRGRAPTALAGCAREGAEQRAGAAAAGRSASHRAPTASLPDRPRRTLTDTRLRGHQGRSHAREALAGLRAGHVSAFILQVVTKAQDCQKYLGS